MAQKRMKDLPNCDRPREKIEMKGAESLTCRELIAAILGRGTQAKDVSSLAGEVERMIGRNPSLISYSDLCRIEGMGSAKASQILACLELGRRYFAQDGRGRVKVSRPDELLPLVAGIRDKRQKHFMCATLNGA